MEQLSETDQLTTVLYRPVTGLDDAIRFKILRRGVPMPLSEILPVLENLRVWVLDERPYEIVPHGGDPSWIYDLGLRLPRTRDIDRDAFQQAFAAVWRTACENDGLNRLVLLAGLSSPEVVVLRAVCKYLRQTGTTFSQAYMEDCLARNPAIAQQLVGLFKARFDPRERPDTAPLIARLETELEAVESLDEGRILHGFLHAILAMLRTNYFQTDPDGGPKEYLSFKVASAMVPEMPLPHPEFEIFVYSPAVEGVHLRAGAIARGGLRWSDRKDDFRTDVLGLMKAQKVKNAVIVPTGAKGGFVIQRPRPSATRSAPRRPAATALSSADCSISPTRPSAGRSSHPPTWCATTARTLTWSSRRTKAPRRSQTSPTRSPWSVASGWVTRSPPAARRDMTTRKWASPRAVPGSR